MAAIAFFDIDKTLLAVNSASLWARRELRTGRMSRLLAAKTVGWMVLYELGFARIESAIEEGVRSLAGRSEAELSREVTQFFEEEVKEHVRPGAKRALARHRAAGETLVLLTSSSSYVGRLVADLLDVEHVLSNIFETDEGGLFTGDARKPLCYGPGKLVYAERFAADRSAHLKDASFYTDSYSDLPVLEKVGRPVAVHPDPRLRRAAERRGWPVEFWS